MKRISVREIFSIPNIIGYFRILMLPVFLYIYYHAESTQEYAGAFVLLAVIFLSDMLDGYIARKYNMITNLGKILDPVADKLVQGTITIAVMFRHELMQVFFGVFLCKEIYMAVMGVYLLQVKSSLNGAQWYGKVCTAIVDVCILLLLFMPELSETISNTIVSGMIALEIFAVMKYLQFHRAILKQQV